MPRPSAPRFYDPEWQPLLEIAGSLTGRFTCGWASSGLDDGTEVHAYKHHETRRYFHLAADGRAFEYVGPTSLRVRDDGYREITRIDAIEEAFHDWPAFHEGDEAFAVEAEALDELRSLAIRGEKAGHDPLWVERQRRFELAVRAARQYERDVDPGFREVRGTDGDAFYGDMEELDDLRTA